MQIGLVKKNVQNPKFKPTPTSPTTTVRSIEWFLKLYLLTALINFFVVLVTETGGSQQGIE